jgi:steroid delta-isomerase-like uncharacterized protein
MTESENEKIALKIIEAYNSQDVDVYVDYFSDDVDVWWPDGATPDKEELRTEFGEIIEAFPDRRFDLVRMVSTDKTVIAECVFKGTNRGELFGMPATNNSIEMPMVHIYDFEAGKVKRWRVYANYQTMMQQLSSE